MSKKIDENIEIRSEKVRNIIGQMPPKIVRYGISLIFFILIFLLVSSYFLQFDYFIKTTATLHKVADTTYISIKIPANEIQKVKIEQTVIIFLDKVPNIYNEKLIVNINSISNKIYISKSGGYYLAQAKIKGMLLSNNNREIIIQDSIETNAQILCGKIRLFDKIIQPFKSIFKGN